MVSTASGAPYQDASLAVEQRVADLLSRMTLEEKAAQMMCVWQQKATTLVDARGKFDLAKARASFAHGHGIGQVGRPSDAGGGRTARQQAELTNAIQKFFIEDSRLGIPVIFHEECLHGHAAPGATSFPQPIGLAATFNPALVRALYTMTALEARVARDASGAHAGRRRGARSALGTRRGNVRRRSVSRRRAWASPRCAASRATRRSATRRA